MYKSIIKGKCLLGHLNKALRDEQNVTETKLIV